MYHPVIIAATVLFLVVNLYLIIKTVKAFKKHQAVKKWRPVKGTVQSFDIQKVIKSNMKSTFVETTYEVYLSYRYKALGSIYTLEVTRMVPTEELAQEFQIGDQATLYFDPLRPQDSSDKAGTPAKIANILAIFVIFNIFATGILANIYDSFSTGP